MCVQRLFIYIITFFFPMASRTRIFWAINFGRVQHANYHLPTATAAAAANNDNAYFCRP